MKNTKVKAKIIKELKHTARDINEMTIDAIDLEIQQFHDQFIDKASDNVDLESDVTLDSELSDFDKESVQITKDDETDDGYLHCNNSDDESFNFLGLQKNSNERYRTTEEFTNNLKQDGRKKLFDKLNEIQSISSEESYGFRRFRMHYNLWDIDL